MKNRTILALAVGAVLGAVSLGQSQPQTQNAVVFKATVTGAPAEPFEIPTDPPVSALRETGTGQADLLGAVQWTGHAMQHGGPDFQTPRLLSDGIGVIKATGGDDAIFFRYSGKVIPGIDSQNRELAFVITGGKGRFAGATGSGLFRDTVDFSMNKLTRTVEGKIVMGTVGQF